MRKPIVQFPDPLLNEVAKPVEKIDDKIRSLLDDMVETMYAEDGVGIAAPQIGVSVRAIAVDLSGSDVEVHPGLLKMINPEIVSQEGEIEWDEGCLSVPEFRVKMKRAAKIKIRYLDEKGVAKELDAEGLLAVAIQQEIDHIDGKLIFDFASRIKQELYVRKLKRLQREKAEE